MFRCVVLLGLGLVMVGQGETAKAGCGTYVLVAGKPMVHEMLPYQPTWRVLNEPQMRQLLSYRWSVDYVVFPPCEDCQCDGRCQPEPLTPSSVPAPKDLPSAIGLVFKSFDGYWDVGRRQSFRDRTNPLAGYRARLERPPEGGHSVLDVSWSAH